MAIVRSLFYASFVLIFGWTFLWPLVPGPAQEQYATILHLGAIGTLVLFLANLAVLVIRRLRLRPEKS